MKTLFMLVTLTFFLASCGQGGSTSSDTSKPQVRALSNDCAQKQLEAIENISLSQIAQVSFKVAEKCKLTISEFEKDLLEIKGVRYE